MRDVLLVARFEVLRAIRTWRALALVVLYAIASAGGAWVFVKFVGVLENSLAKQLGVPETETPGAMLDELLKSDTYRDLLTAMAPDHLIDFVISVPPLAMFHLWLGFLLIPFFAASASAECIAVDLHSRALRFEALRTGRLELVTGRFLGQLALTAVASFVAVLGVWGIGVGFMVGHEPLPLLGWLLWFTLRTWIFAIPFVGIGVAASQLTASPAWARVMAVGATAGTWVLLGVAAWLEAKDRLVIVADLLNQLLPQGWIAGLWEPGGGWVLSAVVCAVLGAAFVCVGYLRFAGRDL